MAESAHGAGRTLPANGTDGQVPVTNTSGVDATDVEWGDAADIAFVPGDASKWHTGNVPTTIAQALNSIAASITLTH